MFRAVSLAVGGFLLMEYLIWDIAEYAPSFTTSSAFYAYFGIWFALLVVAWIRALACNEFEQRIAPGPDRKAGSTEDGASRPEPRGLIIVCSGGGIKSAAFCLGGLERLVAKKLYDDAKTLVGVSGGGYMAAAFAVLRARQVERERAGAPSTKARSSAGPAPEPPLVVSPAWIASRRRLTNYLASSAPVRYELFTQWLVGVAVNILIIILAMTAIGWVVTQVGLASGLLEAPTNGDWTLNKRDRSWLWVLALPIGLLLISFFWSRWLSLWRNSVSNTNPSSPRGWRPASLGPLVERRRGEFSSWSTNLPNMLAVTALVYALVVVAIPVLAVALHQGAANLGSSVWGYTGVQIGVFVAAVVGYVGTLRSAFKGLGADGTAGFFGQALDFFRKRLAPAIALTLYLAGICLGAAFVNEALLNHDWARNSIDVWAVAVVVLVIIRLIGTANQTSIYPFYRDRLQAAYLSSDIGETPIAAASTESQDMTLAWLEGFRLEPELVLCGTANIRDENLLPTGRNGTPFILGSTIGLTDESLPGHGCLPSISDYRDSAAQRQPDMPTALRRLDQPLKRRMTSPLNVASRLTVADAVAISGAALAPVDGRDSKTFGRYRILLAMANLRLGVWLPNPYWVTAGHGDTTGTARLVRVADDWLDATSPYHVIQEAVGTPSIYSPHLYVTDGGHYDNLGIVEALRRRPKRIIMLDGSGDPEDQFPTMGNAIATARMDLGVEISFDPRPMVRGGGAHPPRSWVRAIATYPDKEQCDIVYVKCVLPPDTTWDLQSYQKQHPDFPVTSQTYEMYDEFDFEAFRQLGYWVVGDALTWP
jgi:hypothetical protein